jgi:nitrogen fixation-related uncharacterized protein
MKNLIKLIALGIFIGFIGRFLFLKGFSTNIVYLIMGIGFTIEIITLFWFLFKTLKSKP